MKNDLTVSEYLKLLGNRIKQYRVNSNITQNDLYEKTGVSIRTLSRLEQGSSVQMNVFIKILEGLSLTDKLAFLIPDQSKRPSFYLKKKEVKNKRARRKNKKEDRFIWGDEK